MKKFTLPLLVTALILGGLSTSCGPPSAEENFNRGVSFSKQGLPDEAIDEFTKAFVK
jgi:hypothetical protein